MKKIFNKTFMKQVALPFFGLLALVIVCGFLARFLTGSQTLADYAEKNPEIAYGTASDDDAADDAAGATDAASVSAADDADDAETEEAASGTDADEQTEQTDDASAQTTGTQAGGASSAERVVYADGFYYEPLTESVKERITGISYPVSAEEAADMPDAVNVLAAGETAAVSYDDLRYLSVLYIDFDGEVQKGEMICNAAIAQDLAEIFYELYASGYQIEKMELVDAYEGDDVASMSDNNTSCFNYRVVAGSDTLSMHAQGLAVDINPFYNPFVIFGGNADGSDSVSPPGSEMYADRSRSFAYKIDATDLCYRLFTEHGFTWGGDWNSRKDYQHFEKNIQ